MPTFRNHRGRRGGSGTEPYWRRETSWKKFFDPRHPYTRLGLGLLLSCVPVFGPIIVFAGSYYFGCARGKTMWTAIAIAVIWTATSIWQWYRLDLKLDFTSGLDLVWPSTDGGRAQVLWISTMCLMASISVAFEVAAFAGRGPEYRFDGEHLIVLQDRARLRPSTPPDGERRSLPIDNGAYAARQHRGGEHAASESEEMNPILTDGSQPVSRRSSRHSAISVQIPDQAYQQGGPLSAESSSSSGYSPLARAPIPPTHPHRRNAAGPSGR
ncbi:hypothetical protein JCM5350_001783 [Sporobolomyces pararoseus]